MVLVWCITVLLCVTWLLPVICAPFQRHHGPEDCICNSLRTSTGRPLQTLEHLCIVCCPAFSEKQTNKQKLFLKKQSKLTIQYTYLVRYCFWKPNKLWRCYYHYKSHLDSAQIHWVLDDIMVVVKAKSSDIDRLVERPGIRCMFLRQHFSDKACTEAQMVLAFLWDHPSSFQSASKMMLRVRLQCVFFGLLRWATGLSPWPSLSGDRGWFTELVICCGGGGVRFSLLALSLLFEG